MIFQIDESLRVVLAEVLEETLLGPRPMPPGDPVATALERELFGAAGHEWAAQERTELLDDTLVPSLWR